MPEHKIRPGQVYESCQPAPGMPGEYYIRIQVVGYANRPKVQVATLTDEGRRLLRARWLEATQLHASGMTSDGKRRRTGYRLVEEAPDA